MSVWLLEVRGWGAGGRGVLLLVVGGGRGAAVGGVVFGHWGGPER